MEGDEAERPWAQVMRSLVGLYKNLKRVLLFVGRIKRLERMVLLSETNRNKCFEIYLDLSLTWFFTC